MLNSTEGIIMRLREFPSRSEFIHLAQTCNVVPVCVEILADTKTPVMVLKQFYSPDKPIFLFESVEGGERWGRYSFMGISAYSQVSIYPDRIEIDDWRQLQVFSHDGDPLNALRGYMHQFQAASLADLPRFWGGLVGYLTYEMVSFFEKKIPGRIGENDRMAHFIVPDQMLIFDNVRHTVLALSLAFLFPGDDPEACYEQAHHRLEEMIRQLDDPLKLDEPSTPVSDIALYPAISEERFRNMVETVISHIREGDVIQTVVSQPFEANAPEDLWMLYRSQRFINPSPYLFFMNLGKLTLIGSSPETMVRLENGMATLRPIAGTRPRGRTEQEDRALASELLADEKEKAEHLMLVDLGRNDLGRIAQTGTVQVTDLMVVERYSHVMHLVSNITADIKPGKDAWDLIRASFPAGTLSGAPKVRAMEIIADLEKEPRGPYGGAVGYISFQGNMDLAITIRTAVVADGKLTVRAGAGIVADSIPETERIETVNKAKAIQRALELIQGSR
jgi:anthranilate synthase component 1